MKPDKINVACPHCGHVQLEPRDGYSTVCKKCRQHFRLEEVLRPRTDREVRHHDTRQVTCFQCGTSLAVAAEAESTMCKRCSAHIDLRNYTINQAVSKNFRTHGTFVVGEKGYVFNTEAEVGDAVIKGRFLGKLHAHRTLTIHAPADFKGTFKAGLLLIPAGVKMAWPKPLDVQSVDVAGELVANVRISGTVVLRATGHLFGDVEATSLMVEPGAVLVGQLKINPPRATAPDAAADVVVVAPPESPPASAGGTNELPGLDLKPRKPAARRPSSRTKKTG